MASKLFVVSDAHVKSRLWTNYAAVQGDSYAALDQIAQAASSEDFLLSCGDLLDSNRPSSRDLTELSRFLSRFSSVLFINGNHDNADPSFVPVLCPNAVQLGNTPVILGNLAVYGISWCNAKEAFFEALSEIRSSLDILSPDKLPVIAVHQAVSDFLSIDGASMCSAKDIQEILGPRSNWVFCGDIHVHKKIPFEDTGSFVFSPGPLVPQDIQQARHSQHYIQVDTDSRDMVVVPVIVRDYVFIKYNGSMDLKSCLDGLEKTKPLPPLVMVETEDRSIIPASQIQRDDCIVVVRTERQLKAETALCETSVQTVSLMDAVTAEVEATAKPYAKSLLPLLSSLIQTEDPVELLHVLLQKWKVVT